MPVTQKDIDDGSLDDMPMVVVLGMDIGDPTVVGPFPNFAAAWAYVVANGLNYVDDSEWQIEQLIPPSP